MIPVILAASSVHLSLASQVQYSLLVIVRSENVCGSSTSGALYKLKLAANLHCVIIFRDFFCLRNVYFL